MGRRGLWALSGLGLVALIGWVLGRPDPCARLQARLCADGDCATLAARSEWQTLDAGACRRGLDAVEAWEALPAALRDATRETLVEALLRGDPTAELTAPP